MKLTLLIFTLLVSLNNCYSQYDWTKGKIVLKNGDTLNGSIKLPIASKPKFSDKEKIKFRKGWKDPKRKIDETKIDKIIFNYTNGVTSTYEYLQISKNRKRLFRIINNGKAKLYTRKKANAGSSTMNFGKVHNTLYITYDEFHEYYILLENELIANPLISSNILISFKNRAIEYFSDCPKLIEKLRNETYTKDDVKIIVEEYNNCN